MNSTIDSGQENIMQEWQGTMKEILSEIESKKMVPTEYFVEVLKEWSPYCQHCGGDSDTFLDCSGDEPMVICVWCRRQSTIKELYEQARALPHDYTERMLKYPIESIAIDRYGDSVWVTNGYIAEIAGDLPASYPDRDKFKQTSAISAFLSKLDFQKYERAELSNIVYRCRKSHYSPLIAEIKSKSHTCYLKNDFAQHIEGYIPYISGVHEPILVKNREGEIRRIVLPYRFDPQEVTHNG